MNAIAVVPYDPHWPRAFALASGKISPALGANGIAIHHIGSTSISGMHAKPIIDILAVVSDIATVDSCDAEMQWLGYEPMGEFGIPGRRYFRRDNPPGNRTHHLHAFQKNSPHVTRHLAFRDYLRTHPPAAHRYAELKLKLAAMHPHDMEAYMDGKDGFIKELEQKALAWEAKRS